jgi:tetratricopeptide (TPR) repeat protein
MTRGRDTASASGAELLAAGEAALDRGESQLGFELLEQASQAGVEPALLHRLARAFAAAARFLGQQAVVLGWIEKAMDGDHDPVQLAALHRARVEACRYLDINRVEALAEEALPAVRAVGDEEAYTHVLANASFAADRRGDARAARRYAERASEHPFQSRSAHFAALRAEMFAAVALGDLEQAINLSTKARAVARELDNVADVANESNNLAECYLELGCPMEARACAELAVHLAHTSGDKSGELFGKVLAAIATAEMGRIDEALERFEEIDAVDHISSVDAAAAYSYWLLERGAAGDAEVAREVALAALAKAESSGVSNRLTSLYSNVARSHVRQGQLEAAGDALEKARQAADRAELAAQLLLALAAAEVLPVSNPKRKVVLNQARARILRNAERREDPRAYCTEVRLNRRLLELSGGVPTDLPHSNG